MTMVAKRFMIEADGDAGSIDELKAAVATIDPGKLVGADQGLSGVWGMRRRRGSSQPASPPRF